MAQPVAGLVDVAHAARLRCAFFHNWEPLRDLNRPGSLVFSYFRDNLDDVPGGDLVIAGEAARCIKNEQPDFTFVYLGTLDIAGHDHGWMSADYIACLEALDGAVDLLLSTLSPSATALVTADHGGHGRHHGSDLPEDMTVPLFLAGPGIRQNYEITSPVSILDVAPTLARVMALAAPPGWEGRCLDEAFVP
jgi:predicted AlkP superfamily pyrophosphatase or phosphodiesterase